VVKRKIWAIVTMGALVISGAPAKAESLADALISAYRNSNLLDQNQALLRATDENVAVAMSALRPVIEYTIQSSYQRSERVLTDVFNNPVGIAYQDSFPNTLTLSASLLLLDFGRSKLGIEIAREAVLSARQGLVTVEQDVLLAAVSAYVDVRLQAEIVALRQSNYRLITQELRAARDRFEVGEVTRTDVAQAEARLAGARSGLASAEGAYNLARERYKAAVGHYPGNLAPLPRSPAIAQTLEGARSVALTTHPEVRRLQHEVKAADLRVDLAAAQMQPTLAGRATINENFDGFDDSLDNQSLSLTFNQKLYAGGQLSALYRQSLASQEAARAGLHQIGVVLSENVGRAWTTLAIATASIEAGDQQIIAAQAAFDGVKEEADLGSRTTLDVLDAEQTLLDAKATRLQAEADRYVGVYSLLSTMGLLTAEHLNLGIPTYDPEAYYNAVKTAPAHSVQSEKLDRILKSIGN
jgi:outer membrane protein